MATVSRKNGYSVGTGQKPAAGDTGQTQKGKPNVASKKKTPVKASSPMGGAGVSLGTTHGNHNVAHPVNGN